MVTNRYYWLQLLVTLSNNLVTNRNRLYMFSKASERIEASGIRAVFEAAKTLKDPINFSIGEPDFGPTEEIKTKATEAVKKDFSKYTSTLGYMPLREVVAKKLRKENNVAVGTDNIMITAGVAGGIDLVFRALLNPGDEIIVSDPGFVIYAQLARFIGAKPILVDTYPDFKLTAEKIATRLSSNTKIIVLNNPSNPTGVVISEEEILKIVELAKRRNIIILSDEIYESFSYEKTVFSPQSAYENAITLSGFSKSFGIPGWRLGYLAAKPEYLEVFSKIAQYTYVCANALAQYALAESNLKPDPKNILEYKTKRDFVYNKLRGCYEIVKPDGAFYFFLKAPKGLTGAQFAQKALEKNLLVVPGGVFSSKDTHFRISYAVSDEILKKGIKILKKML